MLRLILCSFLFSTTAYSATIVSQKMGVYSDNLDSDRQRVDLGLLHSVKSKGLLDQTDIGLNLGYDHLTQQDLENQDAEIETREFQLLISQTWDKLTTTRVSAGRQELMVVGDVLE